MQNATMSGLNFN